MEQMLIAQAARVLAEPLDGVLYLMHWRDGECGRGERPFACRPLVSRLSAGGLGMAPDGSFCLGSGSAAGGAGFAADAAFRPLPGLLE
jgi:hypothetical protein